MGSEGKNSEKLLQEEELLKAQTLFDNNPEKLAEKIDKYSFSDSIKKNIEKGLLVLKKFYSLANNI